MSTTNSTLTVSDIPVQVTRKDVKRLHLSVYPPDGQVKVSAPLFMSEDNIRLAIITRLKWIRTQQKQFQDQPRQTKREIVSGESHYLWGTRYRLDVVYCRGKHKVIPNGEYLCMAVSPNTTLANRERLLADYYRQEIKQRIPDLLAKWQPVIGRNVDYWGIKRMKTRWGSCNPATARIWLNLELAKKPTQCLEYVLVHELVHLLEANHGKHFIAYMDKFLPNWHSIQQQLNREVLANEVW